MLGRLTGGQKLVPHSSPCRLRELIALRSRLVPGVWISLLLVLGLVQSLLSQEAPHTRSGDVVEVLHGGLRA